VRHQNPDKFQFKFSAILPPPEIVVDIRESLMLLVSNHILKMAAILKSSADNRRVAIIEDLHGAGSSATEIIGIIFLGIYEIDHIDL